MPQRRTERNGVESARLPARPPAMRNLVFPDCLFEWGAVAIGVFECLVRRDWRAAWAELTRPTEW